MSLNFDIPIQVPVMTLSQTVLFPQAMLPIHIYEPRYRQMLKDVLESHRLLIVASEDVEISESTGQFEPPHSVASVGVIRASHLADDGSSNLIIQGLTRVRFKKILQEEPYRMAEIDVLECEAGSPEDNLKQHQETLLRLFDVYRRLGGDIPTEIITFLNKLEDPETFLDLSAFTLCNDSNEKQKLLETLNTAERFTSFIDYFRKRNKDLALDRKLRGSLDGDQISLN